MRCKGLRTDIDVSAVEKGLIARRLRAKTGKTRSQLASADSTELMRELGLDVPERPKPIAGHNRRRCMEMRGKQLRTRNFQREVWHRGTELSITILSNEAGSPAPWMDLTTGNRSENGPRG